MKSVLTLTLLGAGLLVAGCNGGKNATNIEIFQGMMDQINVKSQDWDPDRGMVTDRTPPENTVARGHKPYAYAGDPVGSEKNQNPFKSEASPELLLQGKEKYDIYCAVCHGGAGKGDGPVAAAMALKPPSLLTDKVKTFSDGRIFHIITEGQGVMGPYGGQIIYEKDRWAVVNYIRTLQKKAGSN